MNVNVFEPVIESLKEPGKQTAITIGEAPDVTQTVDIWQDGRDWQILKLEGYHNGDTTITLMFCVPVGMEAPDERFWQVAAVAKESPIVRFFILLAENAVIGYFWRFNDSIPEGQLTEWCWDEANNRGYQQFMPWQISEVKECRTMFDSTYDAVIVCQCVPVRDPVAA